MTRSQPTPPTGPRQDGHLGPGPVLVLLLLSCLWGFNLAAIKIGARGMAPVFMAGFRSLVAALCLITWMRLRRVPLFPTRDLLWRGVVAGALFGIEFGCIYLGLKYTYASRGYVLLYTQPFFTALGAHFFLTGDRLDLRRSAGLLLAFAGVAVLFAKDWGAVTIRTLPGDFLLLLAGALWGATNLYIKHSLAPRVVPLQTLLYQLLFSAPILFLFSALMEDQVWFGATWEVVLALFYQCIVVAFLSYLVWFELIHRYRVSQVAAFTFFTPVFGAFLSGALILGEPITMGVIMALALVTGGTFLVNRPARTSGQGPPASRYRWWHS